MAAAANVGVAGAMAGAPGGGLASFEKELICSICTEILYQPLTILNCLHTFCGSCVKEWFSHQHRKASSRSSSSSSSANPYTCPTCRAVVRDVQHNATVSNLLELFLAANPTHDRSREEKEEMDQIYKPDGTRPGEKILPKVERRRERRSRREEGDTAARERQMLEDARQRSLRDLESSPHASNLVPPPSDRTRTPSGDREERRQRRRERERQREQTSTLSIPHTSHAYQEVADDASSLPVSSPRHPDAVEARQREHRMSHQASLRSLVSASESGTGTGDSLDEARIMQEILDEGLLGDIDVETLNEAEQDMLAERIADLYRQRHPRRSAARSPPQAPAMPPAISSNVEHQNVHSHAWNDHLRRSNSGQGSTTSIVASTSLESRDHSHPSRLQQTPPPATIARSNSNGPAVTINHRRRASDQSRTIRATTGLQAPSTERQLASSSATNLVDIRSDMPSLHDRRPIDATARTSTDPTQPTRVSDVWLQSGGEDRRLQIRNGNSPARSPRPAQIQPNTPTSGTTRAIAQPATDIAELDGATAISPRSKHYDEPSISCFRCNKPDIQYDIFRHCRACKLDLCMRCYRQGKGCKHWYGFGHAADINFETSKTADDSMERPHVLIGRQYARPVQSTIINTTTSSQSQELIPRTTTSSPADRLQEGHFCDRCSTFANTQFWLCDICNDGEWGFCKECVQIHHCCSHPLLPVAYYPRALSADFLNLQISQPTNSASPNLNLPSTITSSAGNSRPHTPNSATSHNHSRRNSGYDYLSINVNCDMCHNIIFPSSPRYHCPFHTTDYDICTPCYTSFISHSRMRRDGNSSAETVAGWRRCPSGHRMIVLAFEADDTANGDGGMRRIVKHDLVGGWKMSESDMKLWNAQHIGHTASPPTSPPLSSRGTWVWKEDPTGTRKGQRSRTSTINDANAGGPSTTGHSTSRFPPEGGFGQRGLAHYPYWPEEGEDGAGELRLPRGAGVTEIEDVNGDWWSGVYAGDIGVFPFGYVKDTRG